MRKLIGFKRLKEASDLYFNRKLISILILGFSSGLPLLLTSSTLQAWYTKAGNSLMIIGALTLIGLPHTWKFLWAPIMDRFIPPFLGRRRGWVFISQIALLITIVLMGLQHPEKTPLLLAILAFIAVFFSASQDIAINAYQVDAVQPEERGASAAMYIVGYRLAMLVSGGIALILADYLGWHVTFLLMATMILIGILGTFFAPEPIYQVAPPANLRQAIIDPFKEFFNRDRALFLLVFLVLYKISYSMILSMTPTFLLRELGFSLSVVGAVNKGIGIIATIIGALLGGYLIKPFGIYRCLLLFGLLQASGSLIYMLLAHVGQNYELMVLAITSEEFFAGLEAAAIVAFIMGLCDHRFTATQFALLTAFASVSRIFIGPFASEIVIHLGWANFYFWAFMAAIPGLLLLIGLKQPINKMLVRGSVIS